MDENPYHAPREFERSASGRKKAWMTIVAATIETGVAVTIFLTLALIAAPYVIQGAKQLWRSFR